jgi:hypothetical protein
MITNIPTPRTDAELARVLVDFDLTNIDRREALADFARVLEGELQKLGSDFAAVCRTNSENADAMIALIQANGEQRSKIEAQALHNRELRDVLAWLNSHPDAIQRNTADHADGNNWALVLNGVVIGWLPSIEAAVGMGMKLEAQLSGAAQSDCCPHDTNGDGDCHLCHGKPEGCTFKRTPPQ